MPITSHPQVWDEGSFRGYQPKQWGRTGDQLYRTREWLESVAELVQLGIVDHQKPSPFRKVKQRESEAVPAMEQLERELKHELHTRGYMWGFKCTTGFDTLPVEQQIAVAEGIADIMRGP